MTIGERIKALRTEKDMTQTELAEMLETTKQNIFKYENGIVTNIPSDKIEKMAEIFGIEPAVLMGWSEAEKKLPILTEHEITLVLAYRAHPSEQKAVDRILEIAEPTPQPKHLLLARQGGSADVEIKDPEAASKELEKLQRKHGLIK